MIRAAVYLFLLLQSQLVFAENAESALGVQNILSVLMSLGLVIAVIIILAVLVKRFNPQLVQSDEFKVVRSIPLGSKERLMVIEIDNKQHLLGVTPQAINYLYQLEQPLADKEMPKLAQSFSQILGHKKSR